MLPTPIETATIGAIVAADYRTAKVFEARGIDFCCGGNIPLTTICARNGLDLSNIIRELEALQNEPDTRSEQYGAWSLSFLADYIVNTHHVYLRENDDQIAAYARKIAGVHGANHPEVIEIADLFARITADLTSHLMEEEDVFFPAVKRAEAASASGLEPAAGDRETIRASLERLHREHEEVGEAVHAIRHLAKPGFTGCGTRLAAKPCLVGVGGRGHFWRVPT